MIKQFLQQSRVKTLLCFVFLCVFLAACGGEGAGNPERIAEEEGLVFQEGPFALSVAPGFFDAPFDLSVTLPTMPEAVIYFTIDGTEPTPGDTRFITRGEVQIPVSGFVPENGKILVEDRSSYWGQAILSHHATAWAYTHPAPGSQLLQGTSFRFRGFVNGEAVTETITLSYIVAPDAASRFAGMPVVSVTAPYAEFLYIYSNADPWDETTRRRVFQFEYFEYIDGAYTRIFQLPGSTSLGGTGSRRFAQRTLNVHFSRGALDGKITHPIFPGLYELYRFRLWNGGNSFLWDHMRDPFVQTASANLNVPRGEHRLAIKFINGEFWGFTTIREHTSNRQYVSTRLGLAPDNVAMVDRSWHPFEDTHMFYDHIQEGQEDIVWALYDEVVDFARNNDLSTDEARIRLFEEFFCQENFMDYLIANTFFLNQDWPQNNIRLFRAITPVPNASNPYEDGRWRFIFHDMDHAPGPYVDRHRTSRFFMLYQPPIDRIPPLNYIFLVFNNQAFVEDFVARALYLLDTEFYPERLLELHAQFVAQYLPLLPEMYGRFAISGTVEASLENFRTHSENLRQFLTIRGEDYRLDLQYLLERVA